MTDQATPVIRSFFDETTNTATYLVIDPATSQAAIIDPVLDYEPRSGKISTTNADKVLKAIADEKVVVKWILETHAHADHLTAAQYLKSKTGARIGIGAHINDVQNIFDPIFDLKVKNTDRIEFDHRFNDGETFSIGKLSVEVLATPGHTPACISYKIDGNIFVGDTLFMPDYGTARTDFPGGDARTLYRSIKRLLAFPADTRIWLCHDYMAPGRETYKWKTTVGEERQHNIHIHDGISEDEFVRMREARDATLAAPVLLLPSIQVNVHAGHLPEASDNGRRYVKIPLSMSEDLDKVL